MISVVCCTQARGRKTTMYGGSAVQAARLRPTTKTDSDAWQPLEIPLRLATKATPDWQPIEIPLRSK